MKSSYCLAILFVLPAAITSAQADFRSDSDSGSSGSELMLRDCTVHLIEDIDLPALESGQLSEMLVKPGDSVEKGARIAQMNDQRSRRAFDEATLRFEIADERANDVTEVNTAYKRYQLAYVEHTKSEKLRRSGSVSAHEANRARFSAEVAQLEYEGAKKARDLAATEAAAEMVTVKASEDSIARHRIIAPINGHVFEVFKEAGEWVTAGETVMRIARMDRLRITGIVEGVDYDPHEIADRPVNVTLELARGRRVEFTGKVVFVGLEKFGTGKYLVWAEVDNRTEPTGRSHWMLQPGAEVDMQIQLGQPAVQSAQGQTPGESKL